MAVVGPKTKEKVVSEAIASFLESVSEQIEFSQIGSFHVDGVTMEVGESDFVSYRVRLFLDGRHPEVTRRTKVNEIKEEII